MDPTSTATGWINTGVDSFWKNKYNTREEEVQSNLVQGGICCGDTPSISKFSPNDQITATFVPINEYPLSC